MPKLRNIIIFVAIAAVLVLGYFFFIKKSPDNPATLISSAPPSALGAAAGAADSSLITQDFLTLLLSVKNIKLDDSIFSDVAFASLDGSHAITLTPDGTEGRPNPFAPLGSDVVTSGDASNTNTNTEANTNIKTNTTPNPKTNVKTGSAVTH